MRSYNRFILLVLTALCFSPCLWARQLSESEALRIAENFQRVQVDQSRASLVGSVSLKLAYTAMPQATRTPAYYVFNRNESDGFIIVAADDRVREVLGYSTSGTFDINNIPPSMKWWLGQYEQQIEYAIRQTNKPVTTAKTNVSQNSILLPSYSVGTADNDIPEATISRPTALKKPIVNVAIPKATSSFQVITPLLSTTWNQGTPFNNDCPTVGNTPCVTGCVATAMAQIMKYHNDPTRGTGSYQYTTTSLKLQQSFDFGATTFDWNNMLNEYTDNYSEAQANAVATLMHACGVAVNMDYTLDASGAISFVVPWALQKYFGYSGNAQYVDRTGYTDDEWVTLVYNELVNDRPVYYCGSVPNGGGGHAFVCDGYSGDSYFHINWGWGGYCDGDFVLSALNPDGQGIGGYEGGYNANQAIVIGIKPSNGGNNIGQNFSVISKGNFKYTGKNTFYIDGPVYAVYPEDIDIPLGILTIAQDGSEKEQFFWSDDVIELPAADLTGSYSYDTDPSFIVEPKGLQPGKYLVYPAYKCPDGTEKLLRCPIEKQTCVELTVADDGSLDYGVKDSDFVPKLEVTDIHVLGKIYKGDKVELYFTIKNTGNGKYSGNIYFHFSKDGTEYLYFGTSLEVGPGKEGTYHMLPTINLEPGTYDVVVTNADNEVITTGDFSITVEGGDKIPLWINSISQTSFYDKKLTDLSLNVTNSTASDIKTALHVTFYNSEGNKVNFGDGYSSGEFVFAANKTQDYIWNLCGIGKYSTGEYSITIADDNGNVISDPINISIYSTDGSVWYTISNNTAIIGKGPGAAYSGTVTIPATVNSEGDKYPVTLIKENTFAGCSELHNIFLYPATVPFENAEAVFSGLPEDATFYVAPEAYSDYATALAGLNRTVYSAINTIEYTLPEAIYVGPQFEVTLKPQPASKYVNPQFDVVVSETNTETTTNTETDMAELVSLSPVADDGTIIATFKANKTGSCAISFLSKQPGVEKVTAEVTIAAPTGITLNESKITLSEGDNFKLVASLQPDGAEGTVTWTSSDEAIATVDTEGNVTAVAEGSAVITASCGSLTAKCSVTVNHVAVPVTAITLSESTITLEKGETSKLDVTLTPADADTPELIWASSDTGIATVDTDGTVTAVAMGSATITVQVADNSSISATCVVTVTDRSGIDGIESESGITVKAIDGAIEVTGAPENSTVEVYTSSGYLVASRRTASTATLRIELASGYYIVRVAGTVAKVII